MMSINSYVAVKPSACVTTITPTLARSVAHDIPISLCSDCLGTHRMNEIGRRICLRYRYLRALVHNLNDALIDARSPSVDDIVRRVTVPACFRDGGDDERSTREWGQACLLSYRDFLRVQRFACIVDSGQHVRTEARSMHDSGPAVAFAGYIDAAAVREDGTFVCVSLTMAPMWVVPGHEIAATIIFGHLAVHAYSVDNVEIVHVAVPSGLWKSVRPMPELLAGEAVQCSEIVARLARDMHSQTDNPM